MSLPPAISDGNYYSLLCDGFAASSECDGPPHIHDLLRPAPDIQPLSPFDIWRLGMSPLTGADGLALSNAWGQQTSLLTVQQSITRRTGTVV